MAIKLPDWIRHLIYPKKPQNQKIKSHHIWHLVTNHQNMLYILAAGMVMGPAGFRGKYYSDPLSKYPGWIPLFRNKRNIPANFLNQATSERKHLLPCIASFDLSTLTGAAQMLSRNGQMEPIKLPVKKRKKEDIAIFVRAPLPTNLLLSVKFCTDEDMQAFKSAANDVSNVDLISQQVETEEELFSPGTEVPLKTMLQDEDVNDYFPASGQAIGGMFAMLYHTANRSNLGLAAFRLATKDPRSEDNDLIKKNAILSEILSALPNWMDKSKISEQADIPKLFWGVIQALVDAQKKESPKRSIDVALEYLGEQVDQLREKKNKQQLEQLIADLRATSGLGGGTITELLERHKGSLSRSLLLFFLRENCTELMEFSHKLLDDGDYILAGILFGVRDSWLQLPKELRNSELSKYVAFRMAEAEQREQGDKLAIDERPRPKPLREIFTLPSGKLDRIKKDEALELARKCSWNDCIQTHSTLADEEKTSTEVDEVKFLRRLGQWPPIVIQDEPEVCKPLPIKDKSSEKKQTEIWFSFKNSE